MHNTKSNKFGSMHTIDPHRWVARYSDYLYNYAYKRLKNEDLARDLIQETLLAALERMDKFEARSSEVTWLTAILKNKINDVHRKKSSPCSALIDLSELDPFFNQDDGHWKVQHIPMAFTLDAEEPEQHSEFMEILQQCMNKLPNLWFSVFTMKHIDEQTTGLICQELCITSANFWVIIHRAKLNLRACLQKNILK